MLKNEIKFDQKQKIWFGPEFVSKSDSNFTLSEIILEALNKTPNKIVQISDNNGIRLTSGEIRLRTIQIARSLQNMGFNSGDIIGLVAKNSPNLAPLVFAAFACGMPINPLDISFNKDDIVHMYKLTCPKIIFCDDENYELVRMAVEELNLDCSIYTISGKVKNVRTISDFLQHSGSEEEFIIPKIEQEAIAVIVCSSGTTGLPKGVQMTHANILNNYKFLNISSDDIMLCFSSLYWLSGLITLITGVLLNATRIITEKPFNPEMALRMVEQYKVTWIFTPPSQLAMIVDCPDLKFRDLSTIKSYTCGGSMVSNVLVEKINKYLKSGTIAVGYGMSEISGCCTYNYPEVKTGSVGKLVQGVQLKILDDSGNFLGVNQSGEILIKHRTPFVGYYKNPEATQLSLDSDGWVHSGDIGYIDGDGFLFVIDRKKDILKYKNFHFFPSEIEQVILQHPAVAQCCVCGIPDLVATDLPAAAIIKKSNFDVNSKEIYDFVAERMSDFKHLRGGVYFSESFPMTASGKIQRNKLKQILIQLHSEESNVEK